ncbi:PREDICTED: uncharacterized protein LOC104733854 [Camelina sativa]|uniref:Uncharacterized protein LOC104733854 n=1 Tax=Camelina sativa TaxID=90675 RepID=A0ABM0V6M5_CAMSA|nr:PREDICTED: uncharacterized protein LOC104733854 [Camelina sativa]
MGFNEGKASVEIPDDVLANSTPLWEDFLLGKFLDTAPHVGKVHMILNKIWKQGTVSSKIDVYEVNATILRFRVSDPILRARILKRGMWNIAEVSMVVSWWSPITEKEQPEERFIPLWVHLKKVPMHLFSWAGLSFIASAVGSPVRLHPETGTCSNFDVAKVFVNADLSKVPPISISYSKNGSDFSVDFHYPWLPPRCPPCEKWGHLAARCGVDKPMEVSPPPVQEERSSGLASATMLEKEDTTNVVPPVLSDSGFVLIENTNGLVDEVHSPVGQSVASDEWFVVSPSKMSRSPGKSAAQQSTKPPIVSASKFVVLSVNEDDEEGEIVEEGVTEVVGKPSTVNTDNSLGVTSEDSMLQTASHTTNATNDNGRGRRPPSARITQRKQKE